MTALLAIDTSSAWCSVALSLGDSTPLIRHQAASAGASQLVLPWVDELLIEGQLSLKDLDAIAVDVGPGAFTGVRLGIAVVQGLAVAANLPVLPVCSLDAIAAQFSQSNYFSGAALSERTEFVVAVDARMGEVYWARYHIRFGELPYRMSSLQLTAPESVDLAGAQYVIGSAITEFGERLFASIGGALPDERLYADIGVSAQGVLLQGWSLWNAGGQISVDELEPVYVRNKVALTTAERGRERSVHDAK